MVFHVGWPGLNGRTYGFETHPIGTAFKDFGGVYIFCKQAPNGDWHALYVGETNNLNERLNTALQRHQAWPPCRASGATHIGVKVISGGIFDRTHRLALETELRHSLKPPHNRQAA